jgi:hypothetical protein
MRWQANGSLSLVPSHQRETENRIHYRVDGSFYTVGQLTRVRLDKLEMEVSSYGHTDSSRFVLRGSPSRASVGGQVPSPTAADTFQAWGVSQLWEEVHHLPETLALRRLRPVC